MQLHVLFIDYINEFKLKYSEEEEKNDYQVCCFCHCSSQRVVVELIQSIFQEQQMRSFAIVAHKSVEGPVCVHQEEGIQDSCEVLFFFFLTQLK